MSSNSLLALIKESLSIQVLTLLESASAPWELRCEPRDLSVQLSEAQRWFLISLPSCALPHSS